MAQNDKRRTSDQIRNEIHRTRSAMDETLCAIEERLHPRRLIEDAVELFRRRGGSGSVSRHASEIGRSAVDEVKTHPVPLALIGAGVAWMLLDHSGHDGTQRWRRESMGEPGHRDGGHGVSQSHRRLRPGSFDPMTGLPYARRQRRHDPAQAKHPETGRAARWKAKASDVAGSARDAAGKARDAARSAGKNVSSAARGAAERVSGVARSTREAASGARAWLSDTLSGAGGQTRAAYRASRDCVVETVDEHPLAAGLGALSLGILAGLVLPHTRGEDRLMGESAEDVKEAARETGRKVAQDAAGVAKQTARAARDEARHQGLLPGQLGRKARSVANHAGEAAVETLEREGLAPDDLRERAEQVVDSASHTAREETRERIGREESRQQRSHRPESPPSR